MELRPSVSRYAKGRDPCIWMQAGVVRRKFCEEDYNCLACRFDRVIGHVAEENNRQRQSGRPPKGKRGKILPWKENLRALPSSKRPCLHHMKGRIPFKACTHEYRCGSCEFDQYFHDQYSVYAVVRPVDFLEIKGFRVPQGYYFHRGHSWAKIEERSSVRVGIDEFALRLLGPFDRIEAPLVGKEVKQNRPDIAVYRGEHRAKLLSPVSGVVTSINPKLRTQGSLANEAPFSEGWLLRVHSSRLRDELKNLMINTETGEFIGREVERLDQIIEEVAGPLPTDGGYLTNDIYGKMPQLGWDRLTRTFLNT